MSENGLFESLAPDAQAEVRELATDLGWELEDTVLVYLRTARSMATVRMMEQLKHKAPVLSLVGHKEALKGPP